MFKKIRIAPITNKVGVDGYPEYGPFIKLQSDDYTAVEISLSPVIKERTLSAEDQEKLSSKVVRFTGTLKVLEVEVDAAVQAFGFTKDTNGNLIQVVNNINKNNFGVFFQSETPNGKTYQKYLYNVEFKTPNFNEATDPGDSSSSMDIEFIANLIKPNGKEIAAATVYKTNVGWVNDDAEPATMYKESVV